jgi:hypothetical protein
MSLPLHAYSICYQALRNCIFLCLNRLTKMRLKEKKEASALQKLKRRGSPFTRTWKAFFCVPNISCRRKCSWPEINEEHTKYLRMYSTEQRLASSELLTPRPPPLLHPASVSSPRPPHQRRGATHSPGGEGVGGQYFGRRQTLD